MRVVQEEGDRAEVEVEKERSIAIGSMRDSLLGDIGGDWGRSSVLV